MTQEKEALKLALEYMNEYYPSYAKQAAHHHRVNTAIKEALAQPEQEPVQTTPNFAQLKQILDNLDRCHHRDSKQEFLRTWIRDWTKHKLTKHTTPPQRKPLSDYVNSAGINANDSPHIVLEKLERAIESEVKGLNNA